MVFINGIGLISPQNTIVRDSFLDPVVEHAGPYMACVDPNFKEYINPIAIRRMSRLIRMGITAAKMSLQDAGCAMPDAIITGTGLGSVEDTEKILATMREDEKFFNPTPFIQSTYNTISSQIAITLKCHGYNSTYVHRNFSFESALQDALLQLSEGIARNVLAGGIDEMTLNHLAITQRAGHWKKEPVRNSGLMDSGTPGTMAGEGAGFFVLSQERTGTTYASLRSVKTVYKPGSDREITEEIRSLLTGASLSPDDVDLLILGRNGDSEFDPVYSRVTSPLFPETPVAGFKHLCGEYYTATAFALWLAANILKRRTVPPSVIIQHPASSIQHPASSIQLQASSIQHPFSRILVYNQYRNINHTLMLVEA